MKILVTGAAGFVGSHLVRSLVAAGHEVTASDIDASRFGSMDWKENVEIIPCDIYSEKSTATLLSAKPDHLIHLAWAGLPNYKDLFHIEKNLPENYYFLKRMVSGGVRSIQVTGTCFEYGLLNGELGEDAPTLPVTPYGLAKDCLRRFLQELQKKEKFRLQWCRLFYFYGKGQNPKSLLSQLDQAIEKGESVFNMSGGEQLRDYQPVEAVADILRRIAESSFEGVVNCGCGAPVSVRKLVEDHIRSKNANITLNTGFYPYPDYEPMAFWANKNILCIILKNMEKSI